MITRREFLGTIAVAAAAQRPIRPNILFILADDLAYGDLSCFGQTKFSTPNIDQLASEGIRFTDAYAGAAVCAPSRCCLMTGKDTGHARIRANHRMASLHHHQDGSFALEQRVSLEPDDVTLAEVLKQAGYRTAIVGKWGIGEAGTFGVPNDQGFDEFFGYLNQDHALEYYPKMLWKNRGEFLPPGNQGAKRKQYAQTMFTDYAADFIARNREDPFFLYLAYTVPHASSELGRDTGDGYVVPSYGPFASKNWPNPEKGYAEMVHLLDADVAKLMALLSQLGIDSNTLVFFASDNGGGPEGGHHPEFFNGQSALRGFKGSLYEGGIRVPAIARWKGHIEPGRVESTPWAFWDVLPTIAELAGLPQPPNCDGVSLAHWLLDKSHLPKRNYLYWEAYEKGYKQAVRIGQWKGIRKCGKSGLTELFDLQHDRGETTNVAAHNPDIVQRMHSIMAEAHVPSPDYIPICSGQLVG